MYRKLMLAVTLAMLAAMMMASVALGQARPPSGADGGFNCADFDTQEDAQAFFDDDLSDPDGLDGPPGEGFSGIHGVACEELPSSGDVEDDAATPDTDNGTTVGESIVNSYDALCGSFGSQFGAQQYFDFNASLDEQAIMDPNGDGLACTPEDGNLLVENATGAPAENPDAPVGEFPGLTPPSEEAATTSTDVDEGALDEMTELPDTGGPALLIVAGAALVGAGWMLRYRG